MTTPLSYFDINQLLQN